jgi:hypothetical protein
MRRAQLYIALAVISNAVISTSTGASVSHEFNEIIGHPQAVGQNTAPLKFNLGTTFDRIDAITFSLNGVASTHDWRICDLNTGCGSTIYTFDDWAVNVYKPGFSGHAVGQFHLNGAVKSQTSPSPAQRPDLTLTI